MAEAVSRRPLTAQARFRSQLIPGEICGIETRFSKNTLALPCQYHSTNAPLSPVSTIPPMHHSPLSVSFHQRSTLPCQYHSTNAPLSPVSIIPPMHHSPLSESFHQCTTLIFIYTLLLSEGQTDETWEHSK
jgi:hypothetical protein